MIKHCIALKTLEFVDPLKSAEPPEFFGAAIDFGAKGDCGFTTVVGATKILGAHNII